MRKRHEILFILTFQISVKFYRQISCPQYILKNLLSIILARDIQHALNRATSDCKFTSTKNLRIVDFHLNLQNIGDRIQNHSSYAYNILLHAGLGYMKSIECPLPLNY